MALKRVRDPLLPTEEKKTVDVKGVIDKINELKDRGIDITPQELDKVVDPVVINKVKEKIIEDTGIDIGRIDVDAVIHKIDELKDEGVDLTPQELDQVTNQDIIDKAINKIEDEAGITTGEELSGRDTAITGRDWADMTDAEKEAAKADVAAKQDGTYKPPVGWEDYEDIFSKRPKYEIPDEVSQMLEEYQTGAGKIEDLYGKSRTQILAEARRAQKDVLGETRRTGEQALDIFRTRAYGGLPGERQMYEQLGANTAGAIRDITQRGGGGGQGAIADIYGMQQQGVRDIGMQRAQYQAGGIENLAEMTRKTGLDMSDAYRTMSQDYIKANYDTAQALGGAYQTGTAMRVTGLAGMAQAKDMQWDINQYQPALAREASYTDYLNKLSDQAYGLELAKYSTESAQNYDMWKQGTGGQSNAYQNVMNSAGQILPNYMMFDWMRRQ